MPAGALAASAGAACSGHANVSALNQYCEDIPSATGPNAPAPGTPAAQLPASVVRRIVASDRRSPDRKLLRLPGGGPRHPLGAVASTTGSSSLLLILVLVAVAVALAAAAAARRRQRHRLA
ncbi:MAG TPA: hypothetical protein VG223_16825 [Solirubrobacteraceae bacterium]|nr:hypothetical protein [Solirubrobacteraceae bacterium]